MHLTTISFFTIMDLPSSTFIGTPSNFATMTRHSRRNAFHTENSLRMIYRKTRHLKVSTVCHICMALKWYKLGRRESISLVKNPKPNKKQSLQRGGNSISLGAHPPALSLYRYTSKRLQYASCYQPLGHVLTIMVYSLALAA